MQAYGNYTSDQLYLLLQNEARAKLKAGRYEQQAKLEQQQVVSATQTQTKQLLQSSEATVAGQASRIMVLELEKNELEREAGTQQARHDMALKAKDAKLAEYQRELQTLYQAYRGQTAELDALNQREQQQTNMLNKVQEEAREIKRKEEIKNRQIHHQENHLVALKDKLVQRDSVIQTLTGQLEEARSTNATAQQKISQLILAEAERDVKMQALQEQMKLEREASARTIKEANEQVSVGLCTIRQLQPFEAQVQQAVKGKEASDALLISKMADIQVMAGEVKAAADLKRQLANRTRELAEYQLASDKAHAEKKEARRLLQSQYEEARNSLAKCNQKLDAMTRENATIGGENRKLRGKVEVAERELTRAHAALLTQEKAQFQEKQESMASSATTKARLEAQVQQLREQLASTSQKTESTEQRVREATEKEGRRALAAAEEKHVKTVASLQDKFTSEYKLLLEDSRKSLHEELAMHAKQLREERGKTQEALDKAAKCKLCVLLLDCLPFLSCVLIHIIRIE